MFGIVFMTSTVVITQLITPDRFPVRIGDRVVRLVDLEAEQKQLLSAKADLLTKPSPFTQSRAPVLHQLIFLRGSVTPMGQAFLAIDDIRVSFRTGDSDPISIPEMEARGSGGLILLGGETRDAGGRSMQILASFVDGLRAIPLVASVSEPEYQKKKNADGTESTPFAVTVTLRPVDAH